MRCRVQEKWMPHSATNGRGFLSTTLSLRFFARHLQEAAFAAGQAVLAVVLDLLEDVVESAFVVIFFIGIDTFTSDSGGVMGMTIERPRAPNVQLDRSRSRTTRRTTESPSCLFLTYVWFAITVGPRSTSASAPGSEGIVKNTWPPWR